MGISIFLLTTEATKRRTIHTCGASGTGCHGNCRTTFKSGTTKLLFSVPFLHCMMSKSSVSFSCRSRYKGMWKWAVPPMVTGFHIYFAVVVPFYRRGATYDQTVARSSRTLFWPRHRNAARRRFNSTQCPDVVTCTSWVHSIVVVPFRRPLTARAGYARPGVDNCRTLSLTVPRVAVVLLDKSLIKLAQSMAVVVG